MGSRAKKDQVLEIDPPQEITFRGDFTQKVCKSTLTIKNPTELMIAYKVKTTAPKRYCVRPNSGRVGPQESAQISVVLQPSLNNEDLKKHKFMVQSIECTTPTQQAMAVDDLYKNTASSDVMSKKLFCNFVKEDEEELPSYGDLPSSPAEKITSTQETTNETRSFEQSNCFQTIVENSSTIENVETVKVASTENEPIQRPIIAAVPTEPKLIPQDPVVDHRPSTAQSSKLVEENQTSREYKENIVKNTNSSNERAMPTKERSNLVKNDSTAVMKKQVLELQDTCRALTKEKQALTMKNTQLMKQSSNQTYAKDSNEEPTIKKIMMIIFLIAFILGWMSSSFFCNC